MSTTTCNGTPGLKCSKIKTKWSWEKRSPSKKDKKEDQKMKECILYVCEQAHKDYENLKISKHNIWLECEKHEICEILEWWDFEESRI